MIVPKHLLTRDGKRRIHEGMTFDHAGHSWVVNDLRVGQRWLCTRSDKARQGFFQTTAIRTALETQLTTPADAGGRVK